MISVRLIVDNGDEWITELPSLPHISHEIHINRLYGDTIKFVVMRVVIHAGNRLGEIDVHVRRIHNEDCEPRTTT